MQRLSVDANCAMLTDHIRDKSAGQIDAFKHFVQVYSLILGGSVTMRLQYGAEQVLPFAPWAGWLMVLVAVVSGAIIYEHYRSWRGFRKTLSAVAGQDEDRIPLVSMPKLRAGVVHWLIQATILVATVAFWRFNPLSLGMIEGG
ncbi:hypothetical protein [Sphingomicrobium marinum]|uniref:hypothetical protein n=1 Tax=Sphingomicrobium marinum TaxID=1227950 RepID=UPI0022404D6C|nr:hypothetical protein [Sphingomicrobium marinum]